MADYTVWNKVSRALEILEKEEITIESWRAAFLQLQEAVAVLEKKGKQV